MSVTIRSKRLAKGGDSLYLDIYHNGVRSYEFLNLEVNHKDRDHKKTMMRLAEIERSKRDIELRSKEFGTVPSFKWKRNFIQFFRDAAQPKHKSWRTTLIHLVEYAGEKVEFRQITREWLEGFKKHLLNKVSPNSANLYFSKVITSFNIAKNSGFIVDNPTSAVPNVKRVPVMKHYTLPAPYIRFTGGRSLQRYTNALT